MADARDEISKTLGIEEGMTVVVLHEPNWFEFDFGELPQGVTVHRDSFEQPADLFLIFAGRADEAERGFNRALTVLPSNGKIWIAWESDPDGELDEQTLSELFAGTGLVADESSTIDDTWQGLRFVVAEESRDDWEEIRPEDGPFTE